MKRKKLGHNITLHKQGCEIINKAILTMQMVKVDE